MRKRISFSVLFCVIFLTGGFFVAAEPPAASGFSPFKDTSSLYTIHYPSHWAVNEVGNKVSFTGPSQEGSPAVTIEVRQNLQGISLPEYASALKDSYKLTIPNLRLVDDVKTWIGKREAYKFQMEYAIADKNYYQESFILPVSRQYMEISLRVPQQMHTKVKDAFNQMVQSLSFDVPLPIAGLEDESPAIASEEKSTPSDVQAPARRRDPFIDPNQRARPDTQYTEGGRPPGIEGMLFTEVEFVGIYYGKGEHIAVFNGTDNVGYFLQVGDKLWDGEITKITENAVYFKQKLVDQYAKKQYREVVKYLYPVEEGQ